MTNETASETRANWLNWGGLVLAVVAIAFLLRIYASFSRPPLRTSPPVAVNDGRGAEQAKDDPRLADFTAANDRFRAFYKQKRTELLGKQPLYVALSGDDLVFTTPKGKETVRFTPAEYHVFKTFAHMALCLNLTLASGDKEATAADLRTLHDYVEHVAGLQSQFSRFQLNEEQRARLKQMADLARQCVAQMEKESDDDAVLRRHTPTLRDLALQNAYDASQLQIDGLKTALAKYGQAHPEIKMDQARYVVSGVQPARAGNLQVQTLEAVLKIHANTESLVFAEGLFDYPSATALLGTRLLDTAASRRIFGDGDRLWRDLLSDAATAILAKEAK